MTSFAHIEGHEVTEATVHIGSRGPWFAEVYLAEAPELAGRVTLSLGALELVGTIDPRHSGTHGAQRRLRLVAGGGGWATLLEAKAYHNVAGVRAKTIAQDAARAAGETLADDDDHPFEPADERVGVDYVRQSGPASRVLEDVIGGVAWWVDGDGRTHVGERVPPATQAGDYQVLDFDPQTRLASLAVDDLRTVGIGSVLDDGLDEAQTVRELELRVTSESVRVIAWCGEGNDGRLAGLLRSIIERRTDRKLFGLWRYRIVVTVGDRLALQLVRRRERTGLPDILPISVWPGIAGAHAEPTPGAEVLVQFIEGDRAQPIVTHFAGKDGVGFEPVSLALVAGLLHLGGEGLNPVLDGVVTAQGIDSFTGSTYGSLGNASQVVMAKKA